MFLGIAIAVYLLTVVLAYGIMLHEDKNLFSYFSPFPFLAIVPLFGPAALFAAIMTHEGKWGFDLVPYTRQQRWEKFSAIYNKGFVFQTREEFDKEY